MNYNCPTGKVVYIYGAHYGRMRKGKCVTSDASLGCYTDVTNKLRAHCLGKQNCNVEVAGLIHELTEVQCPKNLISYLEVSVYCDSTNSIKSTSTVTPKTDRWKNPIIPSSTPSPTPYQHIPGARQICALETWKVNCPYLQKIEVLTAHYGRMRIGKCISLHQSLGCYNEVTELLSHLCDGKMTCEVSVSTIREKVKNPRCSKDYSMYLEVYHKCIPGGTHTPSTTKEITQKMSPTTISSVSIK